MKITRFRATNRITQYFDQFLLYYLTTTPLKIDTPTNRPSRVVQSVTCLATDACLTADPGVAGLIPAHSQTFVDIDHEIISTVILLLSAE